MTPVQLKAIVRECVAEWFDRMKRTGEIPSTERASTVATSQAAERGPAVAGYPEEARDVRHLLALDTQHAKDVIVILIESGQRGAVNHLSARVYTLSSR